MTTTAPTVEFVDLPRDNRGHKSGMRAAAFVEVLRQNPGKWAVYPTDTTKGPGGMRGYFKNRYGCEVAQRTVDGEVRLYVRWVGESS